VIRNSHIDERNPANDIVEVSRGDNNIRENGINNHDVQVIRDSPVDEERKSGNDLEEVNGGDNDVREEEIICDDIREVGPSDDDKIRQAGTNDDDLIVAGTSVDNIREKGNNDDDIKEVGTSDDAVRGGDLISPVDESDPMEVVSEHLGNNNVGEFNEDFSRVSEDALRQILKFAIETIEDSDKNLEIQKKELKSMERHSGLGRSPEWMEKMEKKITLVKKNMSVNKSIKKKMEQKIKTVNGEFEKRKLTRMKKVVEGRCINAASSRSSHGLKRKLNESAESVIDCGMVRKVSAKEEGLMVMKELLKEENPCDDTYECSFCAKVFTSAGPLTAHLLNHTSGNRNQRLDCPWPACSFSHTDQNLTKHIRSKHTKEQLFRCVQCPKKFHTMETKLVHEKKHWQQNEWDQCHHCLRFYKWVRGGCSFCWNK